MGFQYTYYPNSATTANQLTTYANKSVKKPKSSKTKFSSPQNAKEKRSKLDADDILFLQSIGLKLKNRIK